MRYLYSQTYPQFLKLGLVGRNINYSQSPSIHKLWMKQKGILGDYFLINTLYFTQENAFQLAREGYLGVNVTIPHKSSAFLISHQKDDVSSSIEASNCLLFDSNGYIRCTNTDALALYERLKELSNVNVAVIIGTGATSRSSSWALKKINCKNIWYLSRSKTGEGLFSLKNIKKYIPDCDVLINASPWGMDNKTFGINLDSSFYHKIRCVVDWVYKPADTHLLKWAFKNNVHAIDGLTLLYDQARLSWWFWGMR